MTDNTLTLWSSYDYFLDGLTTLWLQPCVKLRRSVHSLSNTHAYLCTHMHVCIHVHAHMHTHTTRIGTHAHSGLLRLWIRFVCLHHITDCHNRDFP